MRRAIGMAVLALAMIPAGPSFAGGEPGQQRIGAREGLASYYARSLDGKQTASGTPFDNDALVAAHPTYPFGTRVRVTNLQNRRSVTVRVIDRGPARAARAKGVIIDLSRAAADALDFLDAGRTRVSLEVVDSPARSQ